MDTKKIEIDLRTRPSSYMARQLIQSLLETLLHTRHQIPFQLRIFEQLIDQRKGKDDDEIAKKDWKVEKQLKLAMETIERVKLIRNLINVHLTATCPVMIVFGSTIQTAKESYLICFPRTIDSCESSTASLTATVRTTMLKIVQSDEFLSGKDQLPVTNVFVLFKDLCNSSKSDNLIELRNFRLAKSCKQFTINFRDPTDFEIFDDDFKDLSLSDMVKLRAEKTDNCAGEGVWYQSKTYVKGFKDALVNNKSIWN